MISRLGTDKIESNYVETALDNGILSGLARYESTQGTPVSTFTFFDFSIKSLQGFADEFGIEKSVSTLVAHEMQHQFDYDTGNMKDNSPDNNNDDPAEIRAVINENRMREIEGYKPREGYESDKPIDPDVYKGHKRKDDAIKG